MIKTIEFNDDEVEHLKELLIEDYNNADNDEDAEFVSDMYVKLGGDKLFEPEEEEEEKEE